MFCFFGYTTDPGNRITSDGTWTYFYDGEGNVIEKSSGTEAYFYSYDLENRLVMMEHSNDPNHSPVISLVYNFDPFGNRLEEITYTATSIIADTRFGYDGWDTAKPIPVGNENFDAWVDMTSSNVLTVRRVFGAGFDEVVARQDSGGTVQWYGTDHLGSVRQIFDNSTGAVLTSFTCDYDTFGNITSGTPVDRYAYTGREWDVDLKLQYGKGRMYDPKVGRWYSADPLGFAAGDANLYRYVGNGPTNATDPSGLFDGASGFDFNLKEVGQFVKGMLPSPPAANPDPNVAVPLPWTEPKWGDPRGPRIWDDSPRPPRPGDPMFPGVATMEMRYGRDGKPIPPKPPMTRAEAEQEALMNLMGWHRGADGGWFWMGPPQVTFLPPAAEPNPTGVNSPGEAGYVPEPAAVGSQKGSGSSGSFWNGGWRSE